MKEETVSNKGSQVFHEFRELKQHINLVPLPELPEVELGNLKDLEALADKISQAAGQTREWVRSTLGQLELMSKARREIRELVAEKIAKAQDDLAKLFNHEMLAYRRAAWLGLLEHEFSRDLGYKTEVEELLGRLVKEGRLKEDSNGALKAYGRAYSVHPDSSFEEPEVAEIRMILARLLDRVFKEIGRTREDKAKALRAQGSSDLKLLMGGEAGKYVVEVPAERFIQNGSTFWRGGGVLFVESNGQDIKPLDASGSIEGAVREARNQKVFLKIYSLPWEKPPIVPGLPEEMARKVQFLWYVLKRAIRAEEKSKQLAEARETLTGRATVTAQEFFLKQRPGICLAEFQGAWENPDGSAGPTNPFLLVERREEEGKKRIRVADVPDQLRDFFAPCMGEYAEEGNKFTGLPYPLVAVLQAIYSQVLKASQDADKAGQIADSK